MKIRPKPNTRNRASVQFESREERGVLGVYAPFWSRERAHSEVNNAVDNGKKGKLWRLLGGKEYKDQFPQTATVSHRVLGCVAANQIVRISFYAELGTVGQEENVMVGEIFNYFKNLAETRSRVITQSPAA